jgi:hypothetical protein
MALVFMFETFRNSGKQRYDFWRDTGVADVESSAQREEPTKLSRGSSVRFIGAAARSEH